MTVIEWCFKNAFITVFFELKFLKGATGDNDLSLVFALPHLLLMNFSKHS